MEITNFVKTDESKFLFYQNRVSFCILAVSAVTATVTSVASAVDIKIAFSVHDWRRLVRLVARLSPWRTVIKRRAASQKVLNITRAFEFFVEVVFFFLTFGLFNLLT